MGLFRKDPGPFGGGALKCAYCLSDYLEWQRQGDASQPVVNAAVTVIPATVDGAEGGAAVCVPHLRNLLITRQLLASRRERATGRPRNGATAAQAAEPVPRIAPEAAQA